MLWSKFSLNWNSVVWTLNLCGIELQLTIILWIHQWFYLGFSDDGLVYKTSQYSKKQNLNKSPSQFLEAQGDVITFLVLLLLCKLG